MEEDEEEIQSEDVPMSELIAEMPGEFDDLIAALDRLPVEVISSRVPGPLPIESSIESYEEDARSAAHEQQERVWDEADELARPVNRPVKPKNTRNDTPPPDTDEPAERTATRERILKFANEIFGEEFVYATGSDLILHFPLIHITNSRGNKHDIQDLYIKLSIPTGRYIQGMRMTFPYGDYTSHYAHSHLPSEAARGQWASFCLGSTSSFRVLMTNLSSNPSELNWYFLLLAIPKYLEWESLEGGPHKTMASITTGESENTIDYLSYLQSFAEMIPLAAFEFNEGLSLNEHSTSLEECYNKYSPIKSIRMGENPQQIQDLNRTFEQTERYGIRTFKGEKRMMKIIEAVEEAVTSIDPVIKDRYNQYLKQYITAFNNKFNYEYLKSKSGATLGAIPAIQLSDLSNYSTATRKNRMATRSRGKQGVVGRVDLFRKREDNRFR